MTGPLNMSLLSTTTQIISAVVSIHLTYHISYQTYWGCFLHSSHSLCLPEQYEKWGHTEWTSIESLTPLLCASAKKLNSHCTDNPRSMKSHYHQGFHRQPRYIHIVLTLLAGIIMNHESCLLFTITATSVDRFVSSFLFSSPARKIFDYDYNTINSAVEKP